MTIDMIEPGVINNTDIMYINPRRDSILIHHSGNFIYDFCKNVEVEKIVQAPIPEPVILKESTPDAALQLLGLLQKEARFIDFIKEDITSFSDEDIGVAARVVHEGCNKAINEHFTLTPVRTEQEGSKVTLPSGFDASLVRLIGNIVGSAPFTGILVHKGWQITDIRLAKLTQGHNAKILASAEVEL